MPSITLSIRQLPLNNGRYPIRLTLKRPGQPDMEAEADIDFALTAQEQEDLRWYMEDYLAQAETVETLVVEQIETMIKTRGEQLYSQVLAANQNTQAIWFGIRNQLNELRIEIASGITEAAGIPWELMRDPQSDSAIALRVKAFVRVQSNPNIGFVGVPPGEDGRIRLLYVVCRPDGVADVQLRAIANRLLQELGKTGKRDYFEITALRPPTYEQLQIELSDAKQQGRPYHIVHFDGHGVYADLSKSTLADWVGLFSNLMLGGKTTGKHGYLLFENPKQAENMRPVSGDELGKLLRDTGVPVLILNACQTAMHEAQEKQEQAETVHDEIRAIGSLAQAVADQGIPAVLGMRYSVFVVTAAQYIGELYAALAKGRGFGQAACEARKHLQRNPDRWLSLKAYPLQDWLVPVVYEAMDLVLQSASQGLQLNVTPESDPVQRNPKLLRYVPDSGFIGRDETLLMLDRAFDSQPVVLLHAYAGQGKSSTAIEFARWYAQTGGLGAEPLVLLTSFENHTDLTDALNQLGGQLALLLQANGIDWHALNDAAQRRQLLLQLLRQIPVLWIWDNVEPVAGFPEGTESAWTGAEQAELAEFLKQLKLDKATRVKLLLTSRRDEQSWLGGIPKRIEMPRMSDSDAALLALELGQERGLSQADIADWQPLLRFCGGNPMTLRIVILQALKQNLRGRDAIAGFVQALRDGEQAIGDADVAQGRDKSLAASLAYGFNHAFNDDELPVIALLSLFQGVVDVDVLVWMGKGDHALPILQDCQLQELIALLDRAAAIGLLTPLGGTWYSIHPALTWFLQQVFAGHYPETDGLESDTHGSDGDRKTTALAARRAWVEAVGALGDHYHRQFNEGNREAMDLLALEESNLLQARRLARRHDWWEPVISAMQGLKQLYQYQGRGAEWARLVAEIVPDYCCIDDAPVAGRESRYSLVMDYRVHLALDQQRDLAQAAALQDKLITWDRQQAAGALELPETVPLDAGQRNAIRSLGVCVFTLGQILREQGNEACVEAYREGIGYAQRIADNVGEAISQFNLGHAYMQIDSIRNLDAAETAYRRSLDLRVVGDALGRSRCIKQIGMVHHRRFRNSQGQGESEPILLGHWLAAEQHYKNALEQCPATAINDLMPIHGQLGNLYKDAGQTDRAREQYEKCVQICEQTGDCYDAGQTRYNLSLMYRQAAGRETMPTRQRELLQRSEAYAQAALRDFQHYQGRAADMEAGAQQLIVIIRQALAAL